MSLRGFLLGTTLMSVFVVPLSAIYAVNGTDPRKWPSNYDGDSKKEAEEGEILLPGLAPLLVPSEDKAISSAYWDAFGILSENNRCSEFFGGTDVREVLNRFVGGLKKDYTAPSIGFRMSGPSVSMLNAATKRSYRLFEKMEVNLNGPFYKIRMPNSGPAIRRIGSFESNTREVRALMILHELGHLIKGSDGNWLLPDDGNDPELSLNNTRTVEKSCNDQIRSLGKNPHRKLANAQIQANQRLGNSLTG
jgi:hypothetical protein